MTVKASFKKHPGSPQVFRICAVCGKRHGPTYGFGSTLRRFGIKGDKATVECVRELARRKRGGHNLRDL
jgi:hypothetical protein